jgi:hypothetical protein
MKMTKGDKTVEFDVCEIVRWRDGKVAEEWLLAVARKLFRSRRRTPLRWSILGVCACQAGAQQPADLWLLDRHGQPIRALTMITRLSHDGGMSRTRW